MYVRGNIHACLSLKLVQLLSGIRSVATHAEAITKQRNAEAAGEAKKFQSKVRDKKCQGNNEDKKNSEEMTEIRNTKATGRAKKF